MLPFRKILCPTDFSEASYDALTAAIEIALRFSAELILVTVVDVVPTVTWVIEPSTETADTSDFDVESYQQELEDQTRLTLREVVKHRVPEGVRTHSIVTHGDAAHEILQVADEESADLIVIATHGRTGFKHLVFGSVAEKIVRLSRHPVLTIRAAKHAS
jgi:nucleotide-binding universal stress UspA family protein